jgi:hypothetical protein
MTGFGIRFSVEDRERFMRLQELFAEMKKDKDSGQFRDPSAWEILVPDDVKTKFSWPTPEAHQARLVDPPVIAISTPSDQLGARWDFYRVFESVEEAEYALLACELVDSTTADIRIDPFAYPYGGVGPFIALAEAYGFRVLGVNEYGKYQSREELQRSSERS